MNRRFLGGHTVAKSRVLVMGCGGIGGSLAGHLVEQGLDVCVVSRNVAVARAVAQHGFRLAGGWSERAVPGRIQPQVPSGRFDHVFLATQPTDVEAAALQVRDRLTPHGRVICLQNGLCEARVARVLGDASRVIGGVVSWGASQSSPGVFDKTSSGGGFVLGRFDGQPDPALEQLEAWLSAIGPVKHTKNLAGVRWSKLALNCVVSAMGTLNGSTLGTVLGSRRARALSLQIIAETVAVAEAQGVKLEKVAGTIDLGWMANAPKRPSVGRGARHGVLVATGLKYRRMRSSMLRALEAGKPPAVDFLNGEVVAHGQRLGIPTPVNAQIVDRIWAMHRGEAKPGPALIEQIRVASGLAEARGAR
jgi:2-dehydropantoate 2-reductase